MTSNIFGGGGEEAKKQEIFKNKVDTHSKVILNIVERQKNLESSIDLLQEKIELLDHNSIKEFKEIHAEMKNIREDISDIKHQLSLIKDFNSKSAKQFKLMSQKDDVKKLEKYIDLWNPMQFVVRDELFEFREKIKDDLKKIVEGFLTKK